MEAGERCLLAAIDYLMVEPDLKPVSKEEIQEDIAFLKGLLADPVKFERWANDLLDRAHGRAVERRNRR